MPLKIVFIEPKNSHLHIYSKFNLPRIGSTLLATILRDHGHHTHVYFMNKKEILSCNLSADLIAISTITSTATVAYDLADYFRAKDIPVIMGGPHVSALPEEAMHHADYCICGEAEFSLPAFVEEFASETPDYSHIDGLWWRDFHGHLHSNPQSELIQDLDALPYPDYSLLEVKLTNFGDKHDHPVVPIQTSRGCPFNCSFCSVTTMFGRKFRFRSVDHIIGEIEQYDPKKFGLFFYDDNFTSNRNRAKELLTRMIERKFNFRWSTQVRVDIAQDPELLDLMAKAGCNTLYIGFESVDPAALQEMHKQQTVADIIFAIKEIRKRKIHIHGMFVFGFDADRPQTVRSTITFAIKHKIDTAQFLILTPFPGTPFYEKVHTEGRIFDQNWGEYDAHHVKFQPKHFSPLRLQMAQIHAHARFYRFRHVVSRLFRGRFRAFVIGIYANLLNKRWIRQERDYMLILQHQDQTHMEVHT